MLHTEEVIQETGSLATSAVFKPQWLPTSLRKGEERERFHRPEFQGPVLFLSYPIG